MFEDVEVFILIYGQKLKIKINKNWKDNTY